MTTDTQLAPTDDEIDALNDQFRWDTTEGRRDLARAVLARWGTPAHSGEPDYLDRLIDRLIMPPHSMAASDLRALHDEAAAMLYLGRSVKRAAPKPVEREPLTDEQRNAIYDKHCFLGDNGWEINWWQVIDEVEAAHGIKGGQHDPT